MLSLGALVAASAAIVGAGAALVRLVDDDGAPGRRLDVAPADATVLYGCTETGLWFRGCFAVTRDGAGAGFEPLDIELRYQGETCPS